MAKIRPSGSYRDLRSFQIATIIYDATSSQTELRLMNVARSSLEELLLDYEDFLRHRHLRKWAPDAPRSIGRPKDWAKSSARSVGSKGWVVLHASALNGLDSKASSCILRLFCI